MVPFSAGPHGTSAADATPTPTMSSNRDFIERWSITLL
jgi:hypothetical protein